MHKPVIYRDLNLGDKFNVAFPDERIPNGFIDKTKTRVGITYTHFHDHRHSIAVIPGAAIIQDALDDYPYLNLFPVWDGVSAKDVEAELCSGKELIRLVTTPESFGKIITAAKNLKKLKWLIDSFFLYLDEVHCYATEAFREGILTPFDDDNVWRFKDMAMGTATPFRFSDPRIVALQHYKLRYKDKFGKINIVNYHDPKAALHYMLTHPEMFPGNAHIFFNTVTESGEAIRTACITNANVYCRDDERNMANLEDAKVYFKRKPIAGEYQKFNFYSCRYNEGWDLKDDKTATIILVTDVNMSHSLVGIPYKGFQAVGRLKVTPHKIYHITNNYGRQGMERFETIQEKWLYNSAKQIGYYNTHIADCKRDRIEDNGLLMTLVKPFAKFDKGNATVAYMGVDQIICAEYCKEHYNSIEIIEQTWQTLNYNTERTSFDLEPVIRKKKSQEQVNKEVIERYKELRDHPERYVYEVASATLKKFQTEFMLLFEALEILGEQEIEQLGYNNEAMKAALIETSNKNAEAKLRILMAQTFELNEPIKDKRYTNKYIKVKMQELYDKVGMKKPDGSRMIAKATHLQHYGMFEVEECKALDEHGVKKPGFLIWKVNCSLTVVAA